MSLVDEGLDVISLYFDSKSIAENKEVEDSYRRELYRRHHDSKYQFNQYVQILQVIDRLRNSWKWSIPVLRYAVGSWVLSREGKKAVIEEFLESEEDVVRARKANTEVVPFSEVLTVPCPECEESTVVIEELIMMQDLCIDHWREYPGTEHFVICCDKIRLVDISFLES